MIKPEVTDIWSHKEKDPKLQSQVSRVKPDWFIFYGKPFWCGIYEGNKDQTCCFNHIIGLPIKKGRAHPIYDYETDIINSMDTNKHILILKSRGLGITELILRYMCYLAVHDYTYRYNIMPIIVGPNKELALEMIDRVKAIFRPKLGWYFDSERRSSFMINDVKIQAYPSHNPSSYRGLMNVPFVFIDEADFFYPREQNNALDAAHGYISKSSPWIFLVSTPDAPRKLMENMITGKIQHDYKLFLYDYKIGLGKIYTQQEIDDAKKSPSFEREMNLKFLGRIGNVFRQLDILTSLQTASYDPLDPMCYPISTGKILGLDPGVASSNTGFCVLQMRNGVVEVLHADDLETPAYEEIVSETFRLIYKYGINKVFVDASNQGIIEMIKDRLGEKSIGYEYDNDGKRHLVMLNHIVELPNHRLFSNYRCSVVPVNYRQIGEEMLDHARILMEANVIKIRECDQLDKLITSLKSATSRESKLIKEETSYNDVFDAFRQALLGIHET